MPESTRLFQKGEEDGGDEEAEGDEVVPAEGLTFEEDTYDDCEYCQ